MIIPEDTPQTPKTQNREEELSQPPAAAQAQAPPPAYPGYESYQAGTSATQPLYGVPEPIAHTESAEKRFFKALAVALIIWILFGAVTSSIVEVARHAGSIPKVSDYVHLRALKCVQMLFIGPSRRRYRLAPAARRQSTPVRQRPALMVPS